MVNRLFLVNAAAHNSKKIIRTLKSKNLDYMFLNEDFKFESNLPDQLIICGGDGTINRIINQLSEKKKVIFGILPCGKANDLASHLGISKDYEMEIDLLDKRKPTSIDLIKVNDFFVLTGGGIGIPTKIVTRSNNSKLKKFLGKKIYALHAFREVKKRDNRILNYAVDKEKINGTFLALCILNQPFIGSRFNISPDSRNDDGQFELCSIISNNIYEDLNRVKNISKGIEISKEELNIVKKSKCKIKFEESVDFMGDGEILGNSNTFDVQIVPDAVQFLR